jgi:U3 small nucleolar RNA-associated protein 15
MQVLVYNGQTHALKRTLARFPDTAYCGTYRSDGKLLVAGCESGIVQVFDLNSRNILRQYRGHARPTHACLFTPSKLQVLTGSDDATVRLWDLTAGDQIARMDGHTDYVRAAACASDTMWATGSYDHTCRIWDPRTNTASMTLQHGAPVESVAFFPSGNVCVTGGGASVCMGRCRRRPAPAAVDEPPEDGDSGERG